MLDYCARSEMAAFSLARQASHPSWTPDTGCGYFDQNMDSLIIYSWLLSGRGGRPLQGKVLEPPLGVEPSHLLYQSSVPNRDHFGGKYGARPSGNARVERAYAAGSPSQDHLVCPIRTGAATEKSVQHPCTSTGEYRGRCSRTV